MCIFALVFADIPRSEIRKPISSTSHSVGSAGKHKSPWRKDILWAIVEYLGQGVAMKDVFRWGWYVEVCFGMIHEEYIIYLPLSWCFHTVNRLHMGYVATCQFEWGVVGCSCWVNTYNVFHSSWWLQWLYHNFLSFYFDRMHWRDLGWGHNRGISNMNVLLYHYGWYMVPLWWLERP